MATGQVATDPAEFVIDCLQRAGAPASPRPGDPMTSQINNRMSRTGAETGSLRRPGKGRRLNKVSYSKQSCVKL